MMVSGMALVSDEVVPMIRDYCKNRNYKCKGCKWYIGKWAEEYSEYQECMFANCPCDWKTEKEV